MRIYIVNIIPEKININNFLTNKLFQYSHKSYSELYSKHDGQYILTSNKCIRIEPNFEEKIEVIKDYNGHNLLIVSSKIKEIEILSQLPVQYIELKVKEYCFFIGNKKYALLKLIIKYLDETSGNKIIDYYLDYSGEKIDFTDRFFKEDINMLLSLLN